MVEVTGYGICDCGQKEKHWELDLHPPVRLFKAADMMEKFVEEEFPRHCKHPLIIVYGSGKGKMRNEVVTFLKQSNMIRSHIRKLIRVEDVFVVIDKERQGIKEEESTADLDNYKKWEKEQLFERRYKKARDEGYRDVKDLESIIKWERRSVKEKMDYKLEWDFKKNMKDLPEKWKE